jgi:hypothetical protein
MSTCTIMEGPPAAWQGPRLKRFLENIPPHYDFTTYLNRRSRAPEYRSRGRNQRSRSPEYAVEFDGEDDHVRLLANYPLKVCVSNLVNSLKGVSSRMIRKKSTSLHCCF